MKVILSLGGLALACTEVGGGGYDDGGRGDPCHAVPDLVAIAEIQGSSVTSAFDGERLSGVCGVVAAVGEGAFILEATGEFRDVDPRTSDALRVDHAGAAAGVDVGDVVIVAGVIEERVTGASDLPETSLVASEVVRIGVGDVPPPTAASELFATASDGAAPTVLELMNRYEALEASRLRLERPTVVGPTHDGEIALATDEVVARLGRTVGGGLPSLEGGLAEPVIVEARPAALPDLNSGDVLDGSVEGVVIHRDGRYRLQLTAPLPPIALSARPPESATFDAASAVTVATLNVQRLDGGEVARIDRLAGVIANRLGGPDVIGLQEVGASDPRGVVSSLVDRMKAQGGPDYDFVVQTDTGPDFGPLRLALLVARGAGAIVRRQGEGPATLAPGSHALGPSPGEVEPEAVAFAGSRIPLAVELCVDGKQLIVVVVHLTSRLTDDPLMGPMQPPRRPSAARRVTQMERVAAFVGPSARAGAGVVVLGDFNDTPGSEALQALAGAGFIDLPGALPAADRYSYVHQGASSLLDHLAVSDALASGARVDVVHGDADRADARRDTDHDAIVAALRLDDAPGCTTPSSPGE